MTHHHKYKIGDTVYHNYSGYIGEVHDVQTEANGYDYFVRFLQHEDDSIPVLKEWFQEKVLVLTPPNHIFRTEGV